MLRSAMFCSALEKFCWDLVATQHEWARFVLGVLSRPVFFDATRTAPAQPRPLLCLLASGREGPSLSSVFLFLLLIDFDENSFIFS